MCPFYKGFLQASRKPVVTIRPNTFTTIRRNRIKNGR
jgi:hypothetical protein